MIPHISDIQAEVAREWGIRKRDIISPRRYRPYVVPRHIAMWLSYELTTASYSMIGRLFERDHTTVMHGVRNARKILRRCMATRRQALNVLQRIEAMKYRCAVVGCVNTARPGKDVCAEHVAGENR